MRLCELKDETAKRASQRMSGFIFKTLDLAILFPGRNPSETLTLRRYLVDLTTVFSYLISRNDPAIALTGHEVTAGETTRAIPEKIIVPIPKHAINGAMVLAGTESGGKVPVRLFSKYLVPRGYPLVTVLLLILMVSAGIVSPGPLKPVLLILCGLAVIKQPLTYWILRYTLDAVMATVMVMLLYMIPHIIRFGLPRDPLLLLITLLFVTLFVFRIRSLWRQDYVQSFYRLGNTSPESLAGHLLLTRDHIRLFFNRSTMITLCLILTLTGCLLGPVQAPEFIPVKARLAGLLNSPVRSWALYRSALSAESNPAQAEQLSRSIVNTLETGDREGAYALITQLPGAMANLPELAHKRLPDAILTCGESMAVYGAPPEDWRRAETLLGFLVSAFPESAAAVQAVERSEWRLVRINNQQIVRRFQAYRVPVDLREKMEENVIWHTAKPDYLFLFLDIELAHLGRQKGELLNTMIRLKSDGYPVQPIRGYYDQNGLSRIKIFEDGAIGPEIIPVTLVLEVPVKSASLILKLGGNQNYPVEYDPAAVRDFPSSEESS